MMHDMWLASVANRLAAAPIWSIPLTSGWLPATIIGVALAGVGILAVASIWNDARNREHDIAEQIAAHNDSLRDQHELIQEQLAEHAKERINAEDNLHRMVRIPRTIWLVVGAIIGLIVGYIGAWLVSDVFVVFGVGLGDKVIWSVALGFAALGATIAALAALHGWRRVLAACLTPVVVLAAAVAVNLQYGEYTTLGSVFGISTYQQLQRGTASRSTTSVERWLCGLTDAQRQAIPAHGSVQSAAIPATKSGFKARDAMVYLPPAALVDNPPALPVFIMMSGQPGSPERAFQASGLADLFDAYAASHDGLAPIVVSPDQLGDETHNTLCADTPVYGNAETYLTQDVTDWILDTLPADADARQWAIGGFSQGGTCSVQLGVRHPERYGTMMPFASELGPHNGSEQSMIERFFQGDRAAYESQVPLLAMKQRGKSDQMMLMSAGENDTDSIASMKRLAAGAKAIGMDVHMLEVPGTSHDWHAVHAAMNAELDTLCKRLGLSDRARPISQFEDVRVLPVNEDKERMQ
ncbi:alpha/beta hydrolase [Bifidobacterium oedipodis]|uniref:Esterase n=1 Tax=Bifidobacterium oedipodis TaxID=2675322 RepID=A0A7Y0HU47_9BIFI|nr:alpha/beta hydrolase-fold protein [Bifidobacterium sp. DSM 109957]NMM94369.1 esterase [Bifidobacterium sp. DSM 109957]